MGKLVLSTERDDEIVVDFSTATAEDLARLQSGEDVITITTCDIRGDKVRTGYEAPKSVQIHRRKVYDAIRRENREAAAVRPADLAGAVVGPVVAAHGASGGGDDEDGGGADRK